MLGNEKTGKASVEGGNQDLCSSEGIERQRLRWAIRNALPVSFPWGLHTF